MIVTLHDDELVRGDVLAGDVPREALPADPEALALPDRVVHQSHVASDDAAFRRHHVAGFARQVAVQEFAERAFADEADPGGILLRVVRQADAFGERADVALQPAAEREERARELLLVQAVQEIALVLRAVRGLEQLEPSVGTLPHAGVVARRDALGTESDGVVEEGLELDLAVAEHVRIGRAAGAVLGEEMAEDAVLVLGREVDGLDVDADHVGDRHGVDQILPGRAVFVGVVVFPVLHEQPDDLVALFLEEMGRHRGIDAAGQPDDDALLRGHARALMGGGQAGRADSVDPRGGPRRTA